MKRIVTRRTYEANTRLEAMFDINENKTEDCDGNGLIE